MKQKWLNLTWPQRIMILLQGFLILLFLILYCTLGRQQVISYQDELLRCRVNGDVTTYTGKVNGEKAVFTVSGNTLEYRQGDTLYGPYTILFDPTAVPSEEDKPIGITSLDSLVGVEVWEGETRLFRGAYHATDYIFTLVDTDGQVFYGDEGIRTVVDTGGFGTVVSYVNSGIPGPHTILKIAVAPDVVQRGEFWGLFLGIFSCLACALSVLFADALFRWNLRFQIRNPEDAEPSDWELESRWIGWIALTIVALVVFLMGLNG